MVPEGWITVQLKSLLDGSIRNGHSPLPALCETGYWVLGLGSLDDNGLLKSEIKPVYPDENVMQSILIDGDFLISRSNTPEKVGRSARFQGEVKNCSYPDLMMRFRVDERLVKECFLEQQLKSKHIRQYFMTRAAGSSRSMVKINKNIVEQAPIVLPPLNEQDRIADVLVTWDRAIETSEKLIKNSKAQKNALMQQLLTGNKRLPGFEGKWSAHPLSEVLTEVPFEGVANPENFELLTVKLHGKGIVRSGKFPKPTKGGRPYSLRKEGELIIGRQNLHNGGIGLVPKEADGCIASNAVSSFRANDKCSEKLILAMMSTRRFRYIVDSRAGGTGQKEISAGELNKIKITIPEREEQLAIEKVLETAELSLTRMESSRDLLVAQKKALMQQLLTGKRRVKVTA